jgi:hypothetical protein
VKVQEDAMRATGFRILGALALFGAAGCAYEQRYDVATRGPNGEIVTRTEIVQSDEPTYYYPYYYADPWWYGPYPPSFYYHHHHGHW